MPTAFPGRAFYRSELAAGTPDLIWLVTMTYAGRDFRWSTRPIALATSASDTTPLQWDGMLDTDLEVAIGLAFLTAEPELLSVSLDLVFPVDVAALEADGFDLATMTGEVAIIEAGATSYADRLVLLRGIVKEPQYGAPEEPVSFTLVEAPYEDRALYPPASYQVNTTTWPEAADVTTNYIGEVYPIVWGVPGRFQRYNGTTATCGASPAYPIKYTAGECDDILIAGHHVACAGVSSVTVFHDGGSMTCAVTNETDGLGQEVATASLAGKTVAERTAAWYTVGWPAEGAMYDETKTDALSGGGELLLWWLGWSSVPIEIGAFSAAARFLDGYRFAGCIDERVHPYEWLATNLLPLLPVSIVSGPKGLRPIVWRWEATADDALCTLDADEPGVTRVGKVERNRSGDDVVNDITLRWARQFHKGNFRRATTMCPDPDLDDAEQIGSLHATISASKYGTGTQPAGHIAESERRDAEEETDIVYDVATAMAILGWWAIAKGFAHRLVTYEVPSDYMYLEPGDVVLLNDAGLSFSSIVCLVKSITYRDSGLCELRLQVGIDEVSALRSTGPDPTSDYDDSQAQ